MQKASELKKAYKQQIENDPGFALSELKTLQASTDLSIGMHDAVCELIQEVESELNSQLLLNWLEDENIPTDYWQYYSYSDGNIFFNEQEVELED